jgi:hypothetical protein
MCDDVEDFSEVTARSAGGSKEGMVRCPAEDGYGNRSNQEALTAIRLRLG